MVSTLCSVYCLLSFYSRCPAICKSGGGQVPPIPHGVSATVVMLTWIAQVQMIKNGRQELRADYDCGPVHGLGLLRPTLNAGPVCDDCAAERDVWSNSALYSLSDSYLPLIVISSL